MPNTANQKMKQLFLMKILLEQTDENHLLTTDNLIDQLHQYGMTAERKSLYEDINRLIDFGIDVVKKRSRTVPRHLLMYVDAVPSTH